MKNGQIVRRKNIDGCQ